MVVLNVKRSEVPLFLYETTLSATVDQTVSNICNLINGRLKILRILDSMTSLAAHGVAKDPKVRGLLEEQVRELKLTDEGADKYEPAGGFIDAPDPTEARVGKAPIGPFKELLVKTIQENQKLMKNSQNFLTQSDVIKAVKDLKEVLNKVYPLGIPEYDPVRMELENREALNDFHSKQLTDVADPQDTKLWFASKELIPGKILGDYLGKNEKTKVIIKVGTKKTGQPSREPLLSEQEQKMILMHNARRREEIQNLEKASDDSYLDAPWADQQSLKRKVLGLDNISWKPF